MGRYLGLSVWAALVLLLLPGQATARPVRPGQPEVPHRLHIPVLELRYWYMGQASLPPASAAGQPDADLGLRGHNLRVAAMLGHRFRSSGTTLFAALRYDLTLNAARPGRLSAWQQDTLHAPFLRLGFHQSIRGRWGVTGYGLLGAGSDMSALEAGDLRLVVGAAATYTVSRDLRFVFGAMYTTVFYLPLPLPLLGVDYRRGPWLLQVQIPRGLGGWWIPLPWLEVGAVIQMLNLRYGLHAADRIGDELNWLNVTAGPALRLYLYRGAHLTIHGGYNVRDIRVSAAGRVTHDELLWQGGFFSAALGYHL